MEVMFLYVLCKIYFLPVQFKQKTLLEFLDYQVLRILNFQYVSVCTVLLLFGEGPLADYYSDFRGLV